MERINKYIASCGVCSRRKAEELIMNGKVKVNDIIISDLGHQVRENDIVKVEDKIVHKEEKKVYIILNKPKGYITTNREQFNRKSILDLIKEDVRVFPIGRLDMYTEGLLLITNDGEFANRVMHPRNKIEKTYVVTSELDITSEQIKKLENGVDIGEYITKPAIIKKVASNKIEVIISEGKNRQVRRMCDNVGIKLVNLQRVKIGDLELGNLKVGQYRYLTEKEKNMF